MASSDENSNNFSHDRDEADLGLRQKRKKTKSKHKEYDKDNNGTIEEEELKEMLNDDREVPNQIVEHILRRSDMNNDNRLDFNEFVSMVQNRDYKDFFKKYVNIYIRFVLPPNKRRALPIDDSDGSYEERYTCCPPPIGILLITAFQLACFITDEKTQKDSTLTGTGVTATIFIFDPFNRQEVWRFFTYMFVHLGYPHLIVNMTVQLLLGLPLEMIHKWWRVLLVYVCGVIAGSLGSSIMDPNVYLAGASGGVYALITAHIGTIIMNWNEMSLAPIQLCIYLVVIGVDIGASIYNRYWLKPDDRISYTAHIAGALVGLLVGIWVLKNITPTKRENYIWWVSFILFILIMGSMIIINIFGISNFGAS